jgi:hypothetical protein
MSFINNLGLLGYAFLVVLGGIALWEFGVLERMSPMWSVVGILAVIGIGVGLAESDRQRMTQARR